MTGFVRKNDDLVKVVKQGYQRENDDLAKERRPGEHPRSTLSPENSWPQINLSHVT